MPDVQVLRGGAPVKSEILVNTDRTSIVGDGSIENPLSAVGPGGTVIHDETLSGAGTVASPLGTVPGATSIEITVGGGLSGDGTDGDPLEVDIQHDDTLTGDGTSGSPLSVVGGGQTHYEIKDDGATALPTNDTLELFALDPITGLDGGTLHMTGTFNYQCLGNTVNQVVLLTLVLKEDGAPILTVNTAPPGIIGDGDFNIYSAIPLTWYVDSDGDPHVYSLDIITDPSTNGAQSIESYAFNVLSLPGNP